MSLSAGARLGPYEIESPLGAGGMGEVYRARDTRLDRIVALKVLAPAHAGRDDVRERFNREARAISQLTHPHICTLHDVGEASGVQFLVMEYLEGETLQERLTRGGLSLEQTLLYGTQIADALTAAHRLGIVHRDLKPGNVMLTRAGVKLLDFGLAKVLTPDTAGLDNMLSQATRPAPITTEGSILGTPQYMAPEQLEGKAGDARVDLWAFGLILYESLVGRPAFEAASQAGLIAAILERPVDIPQTVSAPTALRRMIHALVQKDPAQRLQTAHDVLQQLRWIAEDTGKIEATAPSTQRSSSLVWYAGAAASLVIAALAFAAGLMMTSSRSDSPPAAAVKRFYLPAPPGTDTVHFVAVSPSGAQLALVASDDQRASIWLRPTASVEARRVIDLQDPLTTAFWAPDDQAIGFFDGGKLKVFQLTTGQVRTIADAPVGLGGSWGPDDMILFTPEAAGGVHRVSAQGGAVTRVTSPEPAGGEESHRWPQFLPDGKHFVFMGWNSTRALYTAQVSALDGTPAEVIAKDVISAPLYDRSGQLLYMTPGPPRLWALPFDDRQRKATGEPVMIAEDVDHEWMSGTMMVTSSHEGTLFYLNSRYRYGELTWFDRRGQVLGTLGEPAIYYDPIVSPDGKSVLVEKSDPNLYSGDVWAVDLTRNAFSRLTHEPSFDNVAVWSPDGKEFVFTSDRAGVGDIYWRRIGDTAPPAKLFSAPESLSVVTDWSRAGNGLLFTVFNKTRGADVWTLPMTGERKARPVLQSAYNEELARFSPDGRWIVYVSNESGERQVHLRSWPDGSVTRQVSFAGGMAPQWRADGAELFYIAQDGNLMVSAIRNTASGLDVGEPTPLFKPGLNQRRRALRNEYAVTPDGQRFLVVKPVVDQRFTAVTVVLNWTTLLGR